jgi:hypothetical protein
MTTNSTVDGSTIVSEESSASIYASILICRLYRNIGNHLLHTRFHNEEIKNLNFYSHETSNLIHNSEFGNICVTSIFMCTKTFRVVTYYHSPRLSENVKITIHKTVTLPVVLYGCETWSLTLKEAQGAEKNIWIEGSWNSSRLETIA